MNMAARLMMKFPNAVTCEETTRSKSSLPNSELTLTPPVTLKGISKPENIYNVSLEMYLIRLLLITVLTCSVFLSPRKQTLHHYTDMHLPTDHQNIIGEYSQQLTFTPPHTHTPTHTQDERKRWLCFWKS